jgi:hypothetical protein
LHAAAAVLVTVLLAGGQLTATLDPDAAPAEITG